MSDIQTAVLQPLRGGRDEDRGQDAASRRRDGPPRELGKAYKHQTNQGSNIRHQPNLYSEAMFYIEPGKGTARKFTTREQLQTIETGFNESVLDYGRG